MTFSSLKQSVNHNRGVLLLLALFVALLGIVYRSALLATVEAWHKEEYSHGYLIPFVTLVLLLNRLPAIRVAPKPSWTGFTLVAACVVLQFLFALASVNGAQPLLLVFFILGFFVLVYGVPFSTKVAGALGFLLFLAPLPKFLYYTLSFKMQMMSTSLGATLLESIGIAVFQEGNIIDLGQTQLQVVEACNGLRYLFPLMALGYLLALMYKASFLKRAFLFLSTVPITIVMNSLRLVLIGVTVDRWGKDMAEGLLHDFEGWIVFIGCSLILFAEMALLQKIGKKGELDLDILRLPRRTSLRQIPAPASGAPGAATVVLFCAALALHGGIEATHLDSIDPIPLARPLTEFPLQLGDWKGQMAPMDQKTLSVLGTDDYLLADYTNGQGELVNLYVLYFPKQDSTSHQAVHSPEVCIPGGGWAIEKRQLKTVMLPDGKKLTVNWLLIKKDRERRLVYYWFSQGPTVTQSVYETRIRTLKNALIERRTNGALIRVTTPYVLGQEKQAEERLLNMIDNFNLLAPDFIPHWGGR